MGGWAVVTADGDGGDVNEILRARAAGTDDPAVRHFPSQSQPSSPSFLYFNSLPPLGRQKPFAPAVTASDKGTISSVRRPSFFHLL